MRGWCTVNTDASFHPVHKVGAFAFWIRHDQGRMMQAGPLAECRNSLEAEIQAIGNGLFALLRSKFTDINYIVINTDCTYAIDAITGRKKHGTSPELIKKIEDITRELIKKYNPEKSNRKHPFIDYRYVPAHVDTTTQKGYINDWCDQNAKNHLWKKINLLQNGEPGLDRTTPA